MTTTTKTTNITIGFIGLGHMGYPMAQNLLRAGMKVRVFDVDKTRARGLTKLGAFVAESVADAVADVDVVITMVQTGNQVYEICLSDKGVFSQVKPNILYIDCSSIDITETQSLHERAHLHHIAMLDAPVSGGVAGAEAASLTFMVGGDSRDFERAEPILKTMGKKIVHAGGAGSGQAAKICNNLLLGISMIGVSEAFTLAQKLGLDPKKFYEISSNASGQCWSMTSYCPVPNIIKNVPANNEHRPGFMAKMMLKDLYLGQHAAEAVSAAIPLGSAATELYKLFVNAGFGDMDFSGIINFIAHKQTEKITS